MANQRVTPTSLLTPLVQVEKSAAQAIQAPAKAVGMNGLPAAPGPAETLLSVLQGRPMTLPSGSIPAPQSVTLPALSLPGLQTRPASLPGFQQAPPPPGEREPERPRAPATRAI